MTEYSARARAHTNIALIKYWGKKDEQLMLPANDSISLTLAAFYSDTAVTWTRQSGPDHMMVDNQPVSLKTMQKVKQILTTVRARTQTPLGAAHIVSYNHVPTSAGLASSASGMAALAVAATASAGLTLSPTTLSTIARRGSGSATRSVAGGLVQWHAGHDDATSIATPVPVDHDFLADWVVIAVLVDAHQKSVSSTTGMARTASTSPFYTTWTAQAQRDVKSMLAAIAAQDFEQIGTLAEANALAMHATALAARPSVWYWAPETVALLQWVTQLRTAHIPVYATVDAGPNVKLLTRRAALSTVQDALHQDFPQLSVMTTGAGPAARLLTATEWRYPSV